MSAALKGLGAAPKQATAMPASHPSPHPPEPAASWQQAHAHAQGLFDPSPALEFDGLTRLTAHALHAPMAVLGLLDNDRLWFKSRVGLPMSEVPLAFSVCHSGHGQGSGPVVVPDLLADARFVHNPWVCGEPHVRAFAGQPLSNPQGQVIGSLAVLDTRARPFSSEEIQALEDLSRLAESALHSRLLTGQLQQLALSDPLTGLSNRAQFDRGLQAELGHAMRGEDIFALLLLDLDGFKAINDGFGHAAGDEVLCEVARRLCQQLRAGDTLARLGGDEFGLILRQATVAGARALANRIIRRVGEPLTLSSGDVVGVGVSVGIAVYSANIASTRTLLAQADQALYQAKRHNARRWSLFLGGKA